MALRRLLLIVTCLTLHASALAQRPERELLLVEGATRRANFVSLSPGNVGFRHAEQSSEFALDDIVRWGSLAERVARPTVLLQDGSQLVSAPVWSQHGPVELAEDQWRIATKSLGVMLLSRDRVQAVWFSCAGEQLVDEPLRQEVSAYDGAEDRVWLASGDALTGRLIAVAKRTATFAAAGEEVEIELARVRAIAIGGQPPEITRPLFAVGWEDGTLAFAQAGKANEVAVELTLTTGESQKGRSSERVCFLQPFGSRVAYLSDLAPIDYKQNSYLGVVWPLVRDEGLTGRHLQAGPLRLLKGLAMHSAARAVYRLDGAWRRFEASVAIDNSAGAAQPGGSVVCRVFVAREGRFEPAFESPVLRTGDPPVPVSVDVAGAKAIALLVDYAEHGDQQDHADWLDARLVK